MALVLALASSRRAGFRVLVESAFVINMDAAKDRLRHFSSQVPPGVLVERIPAVNGSAVNLSIVLDPAAHVELLETEARGHRTEHHQLGSRGAVGCYLSHTAAWVRIASGKLDSGLIFEDDATCERAAFELPRDPPPIGTSCCSEPSATSAHRPLGQGGAGCTRFMSCTHTPCGATQRGGSCLACSQCASSWTASCRTCRASSGSMPATRQWPSRTERPLARPCSRRSNSSIVTFQLSNYCAYWQERAGIHKRGKD